MLLRHELTVISKFALARIASFEQSFKANLGCSKGQLVIDGVESGLLLLDVAGLSHTNRSSILLERVNTYLLLLLADGLGSLLNEIYVLKMLHFAVDHFLPQTQPYVTSNA